MSEKINENLSETTVKSDEDITREKMIQDQYDKIETQNEANIDDNVENNEPQPISEEKKGLFHNIIRQIKARRELNKAMSAEIKEEQRISDEYHNSPEYLEKQKSLKAAAIVRDSYLKSNDYSL